MTQLQELADRAEVAGLVARLAHWLDAERFGAEGLRAVYAEDVVVHTARGTLRGRDAVMAHIERTGADEERTQHFNADVLIDLDGDRAGVTVNQLVSFFRPGRPPHRTAGVHCAYEAVRTPEGWRLARAEFAPQWIEGEPVAA